MFAPESAISSVCLLGYLVGVLILLIKLSLGLLRLILFIIAPNCHSHLYSPPHVFSCGMPPPDGSLLSVKVLLL